MTFKRLSCLLLVVTCFFIAGCDFLEPKDSTITKSDSDNNWLGTWRVVTVNGQNFKKALEENTGLDLSNVTVNWTYTFNADRTLISELSMKFEDGTQISETLLTGTYTLHSSGYILEMEIVGSPVNRTDRDTGTWSRQGNTLTLKSNNGEAIVFQKQ